MPATNESSARIEALEERLASSESELDRARLERVRDVAGLVMCPQLKSGLAELRESIGARRCDEPIAEAVGSRVANDWPDRDVADRVERKTECWTELPLPLPHVVESPAQIGNIIAEAVELHDLELRHVAVYRNVDVGFFEPLVERRSDAHAIARRRLRDVR